MNYHNPPEAKPSFDISLSGVTITQHAQPLRPGPKHRRQQWLNHTRKQRRASEKKTKHLAKLFATTTCVKVTFNYDDVTLYDQGWEQDAMHFKHDLATR